jgi:hypothetical protein
VNESMVVEASLCSAVGETASGPFRVNSLRLSEKAFTVLVHDDDESRIRCYCRMLCLCRLFASMCGRSIIHNHNFDDLVDALSIASEDTSIIIITRSTLNERGAGLGGRIVC